MSGPEGFILLDSLSAHMFDNGFQFICKDIDTLDTALIMHATSRLQNHENETMSKWSGDANDCRTFEASIYTCDNSSTGT